MNYEEIPEKKRTTLYFDKNIINEAKDKIPNISKFCQEQIILYLKTENKNAWSLRREIETRKVQITQLNTEIKTLNAQLENLEKFNQDDMNQKNRIWRQILSYYNKNQDFQKEQIEEGIKVLRISEKTLKGLVEEISMYSNSRNISSENAREWNFIEENYL